MKITRLCETFGVMPSTGGLFDQPAIFINRLDTVIRARTAVESAQNEKQAARNRLKGAM